MAYVIIVFFASLVITGANFVWDGVYTPMAFASLFLTVWAGIAVIVLWDGVLAFLVRRLPERWFAPENPLFSVSKREQKLYRRLKISSWKKHVPELGCFTGFHKDRLRDPLNIRYTARFLMESHYGVVGHIAGAVLGFLILLLPFLRPLAMALPIAFVNLVLNLLPTMLLRYNTPALLRLHRRNVKHGAKADQPLLP